MKKIYFSIIIIALIILGYLSFNKIVNEKESESILNSDYTYVEASKLFLKANNSSATSDIAGNLEN
jgi:hypothetical protein